MLVEEKSTKQWIFKDIHKYIGFQRWRTHDTPLGGSKLFGRPGLDLYSFFCVTCRGYRPNVCPCARAIYSDFGVWGRGEHFYSYTKYRFLNTVQLLGSVHRIHEFGYCSPYSTHRNYDFKLTFKINKHNNVHNELFVAIVFLYLLIIKL